MQNLIKIGGPLTLIGATLALSACAGDAPEASPAASTAERAAPRVRLGDFPRTRKPGAAIEFSHSFEAQPELNRLTTVEITISNYYGDGTLSLLARGDDALVVYQPTASMTASMAGAREHVWRVSFEPKSEGVHYLNVFATVEGPDIPPTARTYAVRIEVGDVVSSKTAAEAADGEPVVIMEAEETFEQ